MDGLSGAASVIAVIQISKEILKYLKAVKDEESDIERLQGELNTLVTVLGSSEQLLDSSGSKLEASQRLRDGLKSCSSQLRDLKYGLEARLKTGARGKIIPRSQYRRLKWPFKRNKIDGIMNALRSFREMLSAAINVDQASLLLGHLDEADASKHLEILEWISPIPYTKHHHTVKDDRSSGTCEWLLKHERFLQWEDSGSSVILWLQGSPGAGKTFLTSKVVDHVNGSTANRREEGVAFFYCNRNEKERRKPLSVLRSYVRQLSTAAGHLTLRSLYHEKKLHGEDLCLDDCKAQLLKSVNVFSRTTLILDAVDECDPSSRGRLVDVVEALLSEAKKPVRVFISSRPDRDIRNRFTTTPNIEIQARHNEDDIRQFVNEEITKHQRWEDMSGSVKAEIIYVLLSRSQGMFQWVSLQIKQILELETEAAIRDRLGKLPVDLNAAYDEIYEAIKTRNKYDRVMADRAFKWVMCAYKPLTTEALLSAIRLDPEKQTFSLSEKITESQLLHLCNNLLVVDSRRQVWQFSHLSVTEYLEGNHYSHLNCQRHTAIACLQLLLETYQEREDGKPLVNCSPRNPLPLPSQHRRTSPVRSEEERDIYSPRHPLQPYCRQHWVYHVQSQEGQETDPLVANLLKDFLGSPGESSLQYRKWHRQVMADLPPSYPGKITRLTLPTEPGPKSFKVDKDNAHKIFPENMAILAMCEFSLFSLLSDWWAEAEIPFSLKNRRGNSLLAVAASVGSEEVCEALIKRGMDINTHDTDAVRFGSALAAAACEGQTKTILFLLRHGADVNMPLQGGSYGSALVAAAEGGHVDAIECLLRHGAEVNTPLRHGNRNSALVVAAARAMQTPCGTRFPVIEYLVQNGADVNMRLQCGEYGSALAAAAMSHGGGLPLTEYLVQHGADVNMLLQGGCYGSALGEASGRGNHMIVEFLVQHGADVNMPLHHGRFGSALAAAAYFGELECARRLIKAGASVNAELEYGSYGTALLAAQAGLIQSDRQLDWDLNTSWTRGHNKDLVELLRKHGATSGD